MRIATAVVAFVLCTSPATVSADQTATWSGQVAYVDANRLGVEAHRERRDFILDKNFDNVRTTDGKQTTRDKLVVGAYVRVVYLRSSMFGSARATEVDILPGMIGTPLPIPSQ